MAIAMTGFHVRLDVAPLKRVNPSCIPFSTTAFPRPIGRGPIEAPGGLVAGTMYDPFPRPIGRGPIEAIRLIQAPL